MIIRGILFDVYGTLIDIHTDEGSREIYRAISRFLAYQGIYRHRREVRDGYFRIMGQQRQARGEEHPEFNAVELWREFLRQAVGGEVQASSRLREMPVFLAEMFRAISRRYLRLYPDVRNVLEELQGRYRLGVLSDAQTVWVVPEMRVLGIDRFFDPLVISADYGFRKPDRRLFEAALYHMGLPPKEVIYVGNDMYRDIYGARRLGLKTVFFSSNQGTARMEGVAPDYYIHQFAELRQALPFFEGRS